MSNSPGLGAADKGSYRAFISYSHDDAVAARWLHRQLESYRIPPRLVGAETRTGVIGKSIGRVFRDRDELAVSADLSGDINVALRCSQSLIVLCSKASARSRWVNQEVVNFKRLKGPESIIAIILDGEPFASDTPDRAAEECFVPGLRYQVNADGTFTGNRAEPIAADLRPGKDGKRLVKMKVIAGLLGVALDDLIRREVQRRNRQLFAFSCAMGALAVILGVLSVFAITSRNEAVTARDEAQRQKVQAEGLIDFMLGDLRDKLRPVGRLDSLEAVGERAGRYFEALKPEEFDSEARARLARTQLLSGEVLYSLGKPKDAAEKFDQAYATTGKLYEIEPDNPQRIFDHAQSEYWVGSSKFRAAHYADAEQSFENYRMLAERLIAIQPDNLTWQAELASARTNLGATRTQLLRTAEAVEDFKAAASKQQQVIDGQPALTSFSGEGEKSRQVMRLVGLRFDLGQILAWEADAERTIGGLDAALGLRQRELEVYREIEALDPKNARIVQARWVALSATGRVLLDRGEASAALKQFETSIEIAQSLHALDPDNKRWAQLLARSHLAAVSALLDLGRLSEGRRKIDAVLVTGHELLREGGGSQAVKVQLMGNALALSAREYFEEKAMDRAAVALEEMFQLIAGVLEGAPNDFEALILKGEGLLLAGDIDSVGARVDAARAEWLQAAEVADRVGTAANLPAAALAGAALQRLSDGEKLAPVLRQVCLTGYRRAVFKASCRPL